MVVSVVKNGIGVTVSKILSMDESEEVHIGIRNCKIY